MASDGSAAELLRGICEDMRELTRMHGCAYARASAYERPDGSAHMRAEMRDANGHRVAHVAYDEGVRDE